jgi:hypothetical protein
MLIRRDFVHLAIGAFAATIPGVAWAQMRGRFADDPLLRSQGRWKTVAEELRYRDPRGALWAVPAGYRSEGASIPRILWSAVGGPWDGSYDAAAIVHDYYCDGMQRSWEATHQVFYDAMRSRGIGRAEATKKYWAVYNFGPRWDARYRWTSLLQLDKKPRQGFRLGRAIAGAVRGDLILRDGSTESDQSRGWALGEDLDAPPMMTDDFLALQEREFKRASEVIDLEGLGPEDVPELEPELGDQEALAPE